ncbi:hypothetical protein CIG14_22255, partial [Aeromonas veronii]
MRPLFGLPPRDRCIHRTRGSDLGEQEFRKYLCKTNKTTSDYRAWHRCLPVWPFSWPWHSRSPA